MPGVITQFAILRRTERKSHWCEIGIKADSNPEIRETVLIALLARVDRLAATA
jgi:hypothetical protein